jgi:hypothetical protein
MVLVQALPRWKSLTFPCGTVHHLPIKSVKDLLKTFKISLQIRLT